MKIAPNVNNAPKDISKDLYPMKKIFVCYLKIVELVILLMATLNNVKAVLKTVKAVKILNSVLNVCQITN